MTPRVHARGAVRAAIPAIEASNITLTGWRAGNRVDIAGTFDIEVMPGESVAIVGESGSGKSLSVKAMLDLLPPGVEADGTFKVDGRELAAMDRQARKRLRGKDLAFVMQDPFTMLNPLQRCGEQITAALRDSNGRRLRRRAADREAVRRLAEVGIKDPTVARRYPFALSGGMRQRVAIAAAIAENPRVLIADEPTTALDVTTQREILELLDRLRVTHGLGLILITHDLRVATTVCDRIYVMYAGTVVECAPSAEFIAQPRHPYSYNLVQADPPVDRKVARLRSIPGAVPGPGARPTGCRFGPRCQWATTVCTSEEPALTPAGDGRLVRCIRAGEVLDDLTMPGQESERTVSDIEPPIDRSDGHQVIKVRGVRCVFGSKVAVDNIDIDVFMGESVGIVGESGSGKTTLARMMVGLTTPTAGLLEVGGVNLGSGKLSRRDWVVVRSTAQIAFQDPYSTLNPAKSVGATLREALRLASTENLNGRTADLLERVGLNAAYAHRNPAQLSGGERQRVAIARALARSPRVIVCDEVVSALDVSVQAHILNLLSDLRREMDLTYVFISHDLAVIRQATDRVYVLRDGSVVEAGDTESVLAAPTHPYTQELIRSIPGYGGRSASSPCP